MIANFLGGDVGEQVPIHPNQHGCTQHSLDDRARRVDHHQALTHYDVAVLWRTTFRFRLEACPHCTYRTSLAQMRQVSLVKAIERRMTKLSSGLGARSRRWRQVPMVPDDERFARPVSPGIM